jgi:hypothetical protein
VRRLRRAANEALAIAGVARIAVGLDAGVVCVEHDTRVAAAQWIAARTAAGYAAAVRSPS